MDLAFGAFSDRVKVKKQDDSGTTAKVTIAGGGPNACTIQAYHPYSTSAARGAQTMYRGRQSNYGNTVFLRFQFLYI